LKRQFIIATVAQFILLFAFWLLLSGHYDLFHVSMGLVSSVAIVLLNLRVRQYFTFRDELFRTSGMTVSLNLGRFIFFYIPWLIWQVVIASLQVAYVVLNPRMPIRPSLLKFKTRLPNTSSKVILGNSITLTPGTITIQIQDDEFLVHALMDASSSSIIDGTLPEQVARLYEKKPQQVVTSLKTIQSKREV